VTKAMFRRRATAYRQMGYRFEIDESLGRESLRHQLGLFDRSGDSGASPKAHHSLTLATPMGRPTAITMC
jgi:hypothetical protein